MTIQPLPEKTSRHIISSLALNDAKSVVKELVDNALDARASAINIEISANTLDVIQVKDNGTGIGVEDRQLLCRRGCTSKIRTMDDLSRLGGTFLGFRGEALASMAELSQAVIVTTRVDGETAGTSLKYGVSGMLSSSSASHPVGTTMRIQNFLANIPVRKQTALKSTGKTLQAIKAVLLAFAFARPDVRFSLKVLRGKNDKMNWTYAANSSDNLTEVGAKIVGKDVASQCTAFSISSSDPDVDIEEGWEIDALLISPDVDKVRISHQYISIDGRPVSRDRKTMKDIVKTYKHHLQQTIGCPKMSHISKPFLAMRIRCPPESYDVNIEPAKDEVLFGRPDLLLSLVEKLFQRAYGTSEIQANEPQRLRTNSETAFDVHNNPFAADLDDLEILETPVRHNNRAESIEIEDELTRKPAFVNPFIIAAMNAKVGPKKMEAVGQDNTPLLNSTALPGRLSIVSNDSERVIGNSHRTPLGLEAHLPSPSASESSPTKKNNLRPGTTRRASDGEPTEDEEVLAREQDCDIQVLQRNPTGLRTWLTPDSAVRIPRKEGASNRIRPAEADSRVLPFEPLQSPLESRPKPNLSIGSPHSGFQWGPGQKPFRSPLMTLPHKHYSQVARRELRADGANQAGPHESQQDHGPSESNTDLHRDDVSHRRLSLVSSHPKTSSASNTELSDIMDFEYRKKAAIAHQRRLAGGLQQASLKEILGRSSQTPGLPRSAESNDSSTTESQDYATRFSPSQLPAPTSTGSNPHRNRYQAALRGLAHSHCHPNEPSAEGNDPPSETLTTAAETSPPGFAKDDPRAYFIRQRRQSGNSKFYRTKSSRLPLESIPGDAVTMHLVLTTGIFENMAALKRQLQVLAASDRYVTHGEIEYTDLSDTPVSNDWESILREMVKTKYRYKAEDGRALVPHLKIAISKSVE
ncbi:hypothetical protein A1O1_05395 [Capronia coronata CBS 617.96]|uniref:DNA mismatch repair protein S5 domain-containing protein n=1 Tax=Capronia coronata CBS 617.96 TaxID=1182541 RepID=W9YFM7_9EURO|nr:uncharacterized protein A1O1_05395 [Capronia coronata CBS 617.96]EXJ88465.1 hypothetical protein A1O1_05395 [Capronia coronata CBS 617.96]